MEHSRRSFLRFAGAAGVLFSSSLATDTLRSQGKLSKELPILLNRNENAYGPSPSINAAMQAGLKTANRFPDATYDAAVREIARFHGIRANQVLLSCGST